MELNDEFYREKQLKNVQQSTERPIKQELIEINQFLNATILLYSKL
jgi:hypothetical protein